MIGAPAALSAQATPLVQVQGLDDPSITGYVEVGNLVPRDSSAARADRVRPWQRVDLAQR